MHFSKIVRQILSKRAFQFVAMVFFLFFCIFILNLRCTLRPSKVCAFQFLTLWTYLPCLTKFDCLFFVVAKFCCSPPFFFLAFATLQETKEVWRPLWWSFIFRVLFSCDSLDGIGSLSQIPHNGVHSEKSVIDNHMHEIKCTHIFLRNSAIMATSTEE